MPGYISEFNIYGGTSEFIELAIPAGTDTSSYSVVIYNSSGAIRQTLSLDPAVATMAGQDVYLLDNADDGLVNLDHTDAIALVDDSGTVLQFISWNGNTVSPSVGPAAGQTSTNIGSAAFGESFETTDGGSTYQAQASPNPGTIPCFARGTGILTPEGPRGIETLAVGDRVLCVDGAAHVIRWIRYQAVSFIQTPCAPRPILIAAGSLGPNRPARDLVVSAQHRVAVGIFGQLEDLFAKPALVPAKSLTQLRGIREMKGKRRVEWFHLALDTHVIVVADGCAAESLFLGPMFLQTLGQRELLRLKKAVPQRVASRHDAADRPALGFLSAEQAKRILTQGNGAFRAD